MFHGKTPFYDMTEYLIFQKIKKASFQIDKVILFFFFFNLRVIKEVPEVAQDLIKKLLVRQPTKRLGAGPVGSSHI
jgi:hypothetical protein